MRLLSLLFTLLIVAFLISKQLEGQRFESADDSLYSSADGSLDKNADGSSKKKLPRSVNDLPEFKKELNKAWEDSINKRSEEMEESLE